MKKFLSLLLLPLLLCGCGPAPQIPEASVVDVEEILNQEDIYVFWEQMYHHLNRKNSLTDAQQTVYFAMMAYEEVCWDGFELFFYNNDGQDFSQVAPALEALGCPKMAAVFTKALETEDSDALEELEQAFDATGEPLTQQVYDYVQAHRDEFR